MAYPASADRRIAACHAGRRTVRAGSFLTQAAILKVTANGTTTSPVPRGAFVMARLLGQPPEPPPANVPAVEPDVPRRPYHPRTTRQASQQRHLRIVPRQDRSAGLRPGKLRCHRRLRTRYRSIGAGDPAPRGAIDPFIGIGFKLGPTVDPSGALPDGRTFNGIRGFQSLLAADPHPLLHNLARQLTIYATGRDVLFSDRAALNEMVARTEKQGGGLRTLLHELVESQLFQTR